MITITKPMQCARAGERPAEEARPAAEGLAVRKATNPNSGERKERELPYMTSKLEGGPQKADKKNKIS